MSSPRWPSCPSTAAVTRVGPDCSAIARAGATGRARFTTADVRQASATDVVVDSVDEAAGLRLSTSIELGATMSIRTQLTNTGASRYMLDQLLVTLPLPSRARELLRFNGRWSREFQPVRQPFISGTFAIENRSGRSSQDHVPVLFAGTTGFGEWSGEVWGVTPRLERQPPTGRPGDARRTSRPATR